MWERLGRFHRRSRLFSANPTSSLSSCWRISTSWIQNIFSSCSSRKLWQIIPNHSMHVWCSTTQQSLTAWKTFTTWTSTDGIFSHPFQNLQRMHCTVLSERYLKSKCVKIIYTKLWSIGTSWRTHSMPTGLLHIQQDTVRYALTSVPLMSPDRWLHWSSSTVTFFLLFFLNHCVAQMHFWHMLKHPGRFFWKVEKLKEDFLTFWYFQRKGNNFLNQN